ncbi:MAG: hypothetical protein PHS14_07635 [Elusimicrobia bacterium]|nr:hypothetical protein [Elusimicrobiota bacterium]
MACQVIRRSDGVTILCGPGASRPAAPTLAPAACSNCAGHSRAYHDGRRRALPWLAPSHCRAWVPENPGGKCRCSGWAPAAVGRSGGRP